MDVVQDASQLDLLPQYMKFAMMITRVIDVGMSTSLLLRLAIKMKMSMIAEEGKVIAM